MGAVADQDQAPLERWAPLLGGETAVSGRAPRRARRLSRRHRVAARGAHGLRACRRARAVGRAGTLFPLSSWKVARALHAASGRRPVVFLANLSGFDGSPESMRNLQLEYGAEIGRAVVNFEGPIVFSVISRYHGGAFVVFSRLLNESMEVSALEHTYASVIGGAPAAAVVFAGDVEKRTKADARVKAAEDDVRKATGARRAKAQARLEEVYKTVHSEKLGEVAQEFDTVHSVERALQVGSIQSIVDPTRLRPYLIEALERGIAAEIAREPGPRPFPDWRRASVLSASRGDDSGSKRTETAKDKPVDKPGPTRAPARRGDARDN
ncbi:MAG: hypothetical protein HC882_07170 [Acidobacteria bacterium]|nr:hypothetical protein [Acidobacteriota bacterium]